MLSGSTACSPPAASGTCASPSIAPEARASARSVSSNFFIETERALSLVEFLHRVVEMRSQLVVQTHETLELATDLRDALLKLARSLLHRETSDAERDDLEVREERVRRRRDHVPLLAIRAEIRLAVRGLTRHDLVVDRFGRQVHEAVID